MRAVLALLLLASFFQAGTARAAEKITLVVEASLPGRGRVQNSLVFEDGGVSWVSSSNHLQRPSSKAVLGVRKSPMTPALRAEWEVLKNALARTARRESFKYREQPMAGPVSPHGRRVLLNGVKVTPGSDFAEQAVQVLDAAALLGTWSPVDAVTVELGPNRELTVSSSGARKPAASCDSSSKDLNGTEIWICPVQGYGVAYLAREGGK